MSPSPRLTPSGPMSRQHVVHGHSYRHSELQYYSALTQLLVLGVLDPTGIMAFALSGIPSLMLTAYEKKHSREDEACADATGLAICARGCFALEGSVSFMAKLHGGFHGGQHASWLDTHPSGDDRIDALRSRSEALTGRSVRSAFQRREHIYDKHCVKKKALFKAARESKRALEDA